MNDLRILPSSGLSREDHSAIRHFLDEAFAGDFTDDDWHHALGGWHALVRARGLLLAHGAVVERRIFVGPRAFRAGYVEAVAVKAAHRGTGLGTAVMRTIGEIIRTDWEIGVLSSGEHHFYERVGWEGWKGPSYVHRMDGRRQRSGEEDDGIMVLRCAASGALDPAASIACEERPGDSW